MKTAISIPEAVFSEAEKAARRLGLSRSELYTKAVAAWLAEQRQEGLTEAFNRVYSGQPSVLDPAIARMQAESLFREKW